MKPIILSITIICLFVACKPKSKTDSPKQPYELIINQDQIPPVSDITSPYQIETFRGITVPITLLNNSNDTLKYVNMSCSSDEIFSTNSNKVVLFRHGCDKNIDEIHTVPPHQSETINRALVVSDKTNEGEKFKVSMSLIFSTDYQSLYTLNEHISKHKGITIWSNEVHIP